MTSAEDLVSPVGAGQGSNWESFVSLCSERKLAPRGRRTFQSLYAGDYIAFRFKDDDTQQLEWVLCRVLKSIKSRNYTHLIEQYSYSAEGGQDLKVRTLKLQRDALLSKEMYSLEGELGTFFLLAKDSIYEWKPAPEQKVARLASRQTGKKGKRSNSVEEGDVVSVAVSGGKTVYKVKYSGGDAEILDEKQLRMKVSFYARLYGLVAQGEKVEEEEEKEEEKEKEREKEKEKEEEKKEEEEEEEAPVSLPPIPRKSLSFAFFFDSDDDDDDDVPTQPIATQPRKGPRPATAENTVCRPILDDNSENELPLSNKPSIFRRIS